MPVHRLLTFLALLAVVAAGCGDNGGGESTIDTAPREGDFSVLTYNVAGLPEGISGSHPEANMPQIAPLLDDYDVVLLQEDFGFYSDDLLAGTDHPHKSEPHPGPEELNPVDRDTAQVGDGLNVFSRYTIDPELDRVPWEGAGEDSADHLALKGFARTEMFLPGPPSLDVFTLHLEAGGDDDALRADDLDELAAYLETHSSDRPVIIGGDWNLHTDEEPDATQFADFLQRTGLTDVCAVVDCGADADEIDKIVYRDGEGLTLTPTSHRFERDRFVDGDGQPLSDHDALAVTFDWSAS